MLDHMILTVSNVERSLAFYEAALKPLGIKFFMPYQGENGHPDLWGFGDGTRAIFWLKQGEPDPGSIHWGFKAESNEKVDEFYRASIAAGARGGEEKQEEPAEPAASFRPWSGLLRGDLGADASGDGSARPRMRDLRPGYARLRPLRRARRGDGDGRACGVADPAPGCLQ